MIKFRLFLLIIICSLIVIFIPLYYLDKNAVMKSSTENVQIIDKDKNSVDQWIVLSGEKKIYVKEFSIWALIEKDENYTVSYNLMKKTEKNELITIVPGDYEGQY